MIGIRNLGPIKDAGPDGWHTYQVKLARAEVARFIHRESDGLAECLRRAATAVDRQRVGENE